MKISASPRDISRPFQSVCNDLEAQTRSPSMRPVDFCCQWKSTSEMMNIQVIRPAAGISLVYHSTGSGPVVIVLPSIGRGAAEMQPFAQALADGGVRVLLVEPRGIGGSIGPESYTLHDLAADIAGLIDATGTGPAILAGHAFGNWVARMTATLYPEKILGVVLLAAAAREWPRSIVSDIELCSDGTRDDRERLAALQRVFFAKGNDPAAWLQGWHPDVLDRQKKAGAAVDQTEWWAAGRAPILDIQADEDPFRPLESADELCSALPGRVETLRIPGASHALPVERPSETAVAILRWLAAKGIAATDRVGAQASDSGIN
jgi:pimeloyl-ACP methyl ester carboxylesterase